MIPAMLETLDLTRELPKSEYKAAMERLDLELPTLQRAIRRYKVPVLVLFEGWYASGRGDSIARIMHRLDPRGAKVHVTHASRNDFDLYPWMWRFWQRVPARGRIEIFDRSWYYLVWNLRDEEKVGAAEWERRMAEIDEFERQLVDDGAVLLKFWLHVSAKEQRRRLKDWTKDETQQWRVSDEDWKRHEHYERRLALAEEMIARTHTHRAPWTLVEAEDERHRRVRVMTTVVETLRDALRRRGVPENELSVVEDEPIPESAVDAPDDPLPDPLEVSDDSLLARVDRNLALEVDEYRPRLKEAQKRLRKLSFACYRERRSVVVVFEGWDAAGKGGAIKRLTARLDPRGYDVVPIGAPSRVELARHHLWRFWTEVPRDGHWTIYDRSWYGRVLVERVEGFADEEQWRRAYQEINEFERWLAQHGSVLVKFWLDISPEEQMRRFVRRLASPVRHHKITDEDWRNRARWPEYYAAVSDMLRHTSTAHAPWTIVEAEDKRWARVKVCETVARTVEAHLGREPA
jgi:polyphosphate kinase 2 (PPK2 family)